MKKLLFIIMIHIFHISCHAQIDSLYIKPFEYRLAIQPYISKSLLFMNQEFESGKEISFLPNDPPNIGIGISLNNTIINFSYGYGFDFMRDKEYGKTKSFDFQIHNYGRKFVFDLFIQRYKGFYDGDSDKNIILYPDMQIHQYGIHGHYVFNHNKHSYKAAFNRSEKQLKSAGSFLLGGGIYHTKIRSDSSFYYKETNSFDNFQFGISAGYAYTWVLSKYWDISTSTTVGINFGSNKPKNLRKNFEVYPTVFPRISAGYTRSDWSLGFSYVGNIVFPSMTDNSSIGIHSGNFQLFYIKRFNLIPLINK